jgi:hypothetical protein
VSNDREYLVLFSGHNHAPQVKHRARNWEEAIDYLHESLNGWPVWVDSVEVRGPRKVEVKIK